MSGWLAHRTGITQAVVVTACWFAAPFVFGWPTSAAVFWYLALCTFISFATQFTLAYQNRKAEATLELALRNMTDLMRLTVALAKEIQGEQAEILAELEDLAPPGDSPLVDQAPLGGA